jgi:2-octaprenylphenol hydroxylase
MIVNMKFDVVIVGGGLVGSSLAAALKDSGLSLALVESQSSLMADGPPSSERSTSDQSWDRRIYAVSPGSRSFLERCGAWDHLDIARIEAVQKMRVFGDTGSELEFSAYEMGVAELACILENSVLQRALWQVLHAQENLTVYKPAHCAGLRFDKDLATLTLQDGSELHGRLIVAADGRDSWIRSHAGVSASPVDYQQCAVVANFDCELPHRGIAYQWFQVHGILALLPLPGNRVSMVWSVDSGRSEELMAMSHDELSGKVCEAAKGIVGALKVITRPASFPLRLLVLPKITLPRVALIGDAAHNMHPLAGQGVNTGFRDARELAAVLAGRGPQHDCGDELLLRRFERKRKEDIYSMQAATYGLKHLFNNDIALLRVLRNVGLDATNRIVPLKKMLMQHAMH